MGSFGTCLWSGYSTYHDQENCLERSIENARDEETIKYMESEKSGVMFSKEFYENPLKYAIKEIESIQEDIDILVGIFGDFPKKK
jgi:hypothetical protein